MFKKSLSILLALTTLLPISANAVLIDHVYEINFDGTNYTESYVGDLNLEQGGTVQLAFHADDLDYWTGMTATSIWFPINVEESGDRTGNYSWSYLLDDTIVSFGEKLGELSSFVHIIGHIDGYSGMFDSVIIDYTLDSSTTGNVNSLDADTSAFGIFGVDLPINFDAIYVDNLSSEDVPEPSALLLIAFGFISLSFARMRKK